MQHRLSRMHPAPAGRVRVVHFSSTHLADDARIFAKECVGLARAGYEVSYVIPDNRYRSADGRPTRRQEVDIVAVKRRSGLLPRLLGTTASVLRASLKQRADVYHFHDPELIPAGLLLRLLGKRTVYDVHEDLPRDIVTRAWIPRALRRPLAAVAEGVEWLAGRTMSGVVAATPVIARRFPPARTALVQNFALFNEFTGEGAPPFAERRGVAFVGSITADRCTAEMVDAMGLAAEGHGARLLLAGNIESAALRARMEASPGWPRVDFRGRLDRAGVQRLLGESRVGVALYYPTQNYFDTQPVKLFEYMAAGIPVITVDFPYHRGIVEQNRCGLCVPPCDPAAIAAAIDWMFANPEEAEAMGRRGREVVKTLYNWANEERELMKLYDRIAPLDGRAAVRPAGLVGEGTGESPL